MKTKILIAAALAVCLTNGAQARIGEAEPQIEKRFGKPVKESKDQTTGDPFKIYVSGEFAVGVYFDAGHSVGEMYMPRNAPALTETQIKHLLQINTSKEWLFVRQEVDGSQTWTIYGGSLWGQYQMAHHDLFVTTRKFLEQSKNGRDAQELAGLANF